MLGCLTGLRHLYLYLSIYLYLYAGDRNGAKALLHRLRHAARPKSHYTHDVRFTLKQQKAIKSVELKELVCSRIPGQGVYLLMRSAKDGTAGWRPRAEPELGLRLSFGSIC